MHLDNSSIEKWASALLFISSALFLPRSYAKPELRLNVFFSYVLWREPNLSFGTETSVPPFRTLPDVIQTEELVSFKVPVKILQSKRALSFLFFCEENLVLTKVIAKNELVVTFVCIVYFKGIKTFNVRKSSLLFASLHICTWLYISFC